ncbi:MAG: S41 family peptidase [Bacteroidales bacterium]
MKKSITTLLFCALYLLSNAQVAPKWLRYPVISPNGDKIAFAYKGDIYIVSTQGGVATPITFNEAHDYMPVWSHDGKQIAFASNRHGNFDVYVVNAEGGEPRRLTFHSADEIPYSFSNDDKSVVFGATRQDIVTHRQYPTGSQPELYSVPSVGGRVELVLTTPAEAVQFSSDGNFLVYHDKKGGENEWRKHHQSSIARDIWTYNFKSGKHTKITDFKGEDRNPILADNNSSIYYLSEESGNFNVFKLLLSNPDQKKQITTYEKYPVRFLSMSKNQTLCYGFDGEIYTLSEGSSPKKVEITIKGEEQQNRDQLVKINGNVKEMAVSPDGKEVAFIARGEVFVSSVEGSFTKRITSTPEQEKFVTFSPDGKSIVYSSERNGRWQIYKSTKVRTDEPFFFASTLIKEELLIDNENENSQPQFSPDGKELAFIENRTNLKVMNLETKQSRTLLTSNELYYMSDGGQYFTWSPDGKWLLVDYSPVMSNGEIVLVSADGKVPFKNLTQNGHEDYSAKWVNGGKQMLWFTTRDGLRSYANSGRRQSDVYCMFFTHDAWDRFNLSKDEYDLLKSIEDKKKEAVSESDSSKKKNDSKSKDKKKKDDEVKKDSSLKFDWDDLTDRTARLTVNSASIADAVLSKDGETLYYLASFEKGYNLWSVNIRKKEAKIEIELDANSGSFEWDKEMKNLFLLADGKIYKVDLGKSKEVPVKINSEIKIDSYSERKAMFDHVVLRTEKGFYTKQYHGINWKELTQHYEQYLPYIGDGFEFTEMLSEMLGELNGSHSGARYYSRSADGDRTASLGIFADYSYKNDGIKVAEVLKGGPLDKANINVKVGDIIQKIDGETVSSNTDFASYLNRKADKFTLLDVFDPTLGVTKQITVKPISIGDESDLLYKRWVKKNRAEVDSLSNGQLGYVHVEGMGDGPYRDTYSEMMGKYYDRKGVIVDTRFNGGGDLVSDLAMFLTGHKYIEYQNDTRVLGSEPTFRWTKPTVALVGEANYSDASCFACGYQQLGIGKMIGMPVPGTCSFAGWERLQDGETLWGMVPVSSKDINGNWMENLEAVPDYVVKNAPEEIATGRDQQLEKAIEVLLEEVK